METQLPSPKRVTAPNFRPISIVAKWLDASRCHALGMEVGLSPGHIVLDGDPVPPTNGRLREGVRQIFKSLWVPLSVTTRDRGSEQFKESSV